MRLNRSAPAATGPRPGVRGLLHRHASRKKKHRSLARHSALLQSSRGGPPAGDTDGPDRVGPAYPAAPMYKYAETGSVRACSRSISGARADQTPGSESGGPVPAHLPGCLPLPLHRSSLPFSTTSAGSCCCSTAPAGSCCYTARMEEYSGDVFFHGDDDSYGDGHSYGNIDATRDFLSQPPTGQGYNQAAFTGPGSGHFASPRTSMAALDLNSQGSQWPPMGGYQGLLRFGLQGGDVDGPNASPLVGAHSASRSVGAGGVGFRAPRSTGVGAGSRCATSTFSGGGRGSGVPAVGRGASQRSLHGPW